MGREVRMVPADWQHPKNSQGRHIPLFEHDEYELALKEYYKLVHQDGEEEANEFYGGKPERSDYMPCWAKVQRTHYMMYETTTEGTPISPAFDSPDKLARYLANTGASACGNLMATYDQWLAMIQDSEAAVSMVRTADGRIVSGVEYLSEQK